MKIVLSLLAVVIACGTATLGALLFAVCQIGDSEIISRCGFAFILFAPTAGILVTILLPAKSGTAWLAAPLSLLVAIIVYGSTGFLAEWATHSLAAKSTTRAFWAIYWVGGFAFTATYLWQSRSLWRWTFAELQKSPSKSPETTRGK